LKNVSLVAARDGCDSERGMSTDERREARIRFDAKVHARLMGIDGTWQRACIVYDVSNGGAKLRVNDSLKGLSLKEFFLVLSSTGLAYRHCKLIWVNGDYIGVAFLRRGKRVTHSLRGG
jgi:hypothetical protein